MWGEVLFSACGCAGISWGRFTDVSTAAQGGITSLSHIGTHDFCQSYKQAHFCQAGAILLKTAEAKSTLLGFTKYTQGT